MAEASQRSNDILEGVCRLRHIGSWHPGPHGILLLIEHRCSHMTFFLYRDKDGQHRGEIDLRKKSP